MYANSTWRDIDRAAIDHVLQWSREATPRVTGAMMADVLGYTPASMYRKLKYQFTPLTIGEFEHLCRYFRKDPDREWLRIHQTVALRRGDRRTAAIIQHELRDQRVRGDIVALALTYLDEKDTPEPPRPSKKAGAEERRSRVTA